MTRAAGSSHAGLQRDQNEDRYLVDPVRGLYAVIDGVGGHAGGERASAIALDLLATRLSRETGSPAERLREGIALANNAILAEAASSPTLAGMTCVLTAAIVSGTDLVAGHVGDTRLYRIRQGRIEKLTHDHSPVGEREDAGDITEAEAMQHPRRNEVYRDVGAQPRGPDDEGFIEIVETTLDADAALVLCSDGLSDQVTAQAIRRIVEEHAGSPAASVAGLIRAANDAGGKDNVTVVVVEGETFAARRGPRAAGDGSPASPRVASLGRQTLLFCAGIALGLLLGLAALWMLRPDVFRRAPALVADPGLATAPRTWRVGLDAAADAATIGDALAVAQDHDVIELSPGEYREAVVIDKPIVLDGQEGVVIRPPLGTTGPWTAVTISGGSGVVIRQLAIEGSSEQPMATGVLVRGGAVALHGVTVTGAGDAAVVVSTGGQADIEGATIRDNPGVGLHVLHGGRLALRRSLVVRNGVGRQPRAGVVVDAGADVTVLGNGIADNGGAAVSGLDAAAAESLARNNVVRPLPRPPARRPAPAPAPRTPAPEAPR